MNRLLAHIFDKSACLTKRQLKNYVTGVMAEEECYAVERHANDCSFCSEAIDGLSAHNSEAVNLLETLTPEFIHDHFHKNLPPVHLNSIAPAVTAEPAPAKHKKNGISWVQISALTATLLLAFFLIRGWEPAYRKITLPVSADNTPPVVIQNPEPEPGKKKTALPPTEKKESSATARPDPPAAKTTTMTDPLRDEKDISPVQEQNTATDLPAQSGTTTRLYNAPSVAEETTATISTSGTDHTNHLQLANEAFERAHYTKALHHYRQVLSNNAARQEDRDAAGIKAARCYILLGSKAQAITLLREIADGNSPHSKDAGTLLAELN